MAKQNGERQATVGEALTERVEARRGTATGWAGALRELGAVDRAVYEAVAGTPTPERSPTPLAGTYRGLPCRSGCWRAASPTRESTQACITQATW
jgi:hypothetical protein